LWAWHTQYLSKVSAKEDRLNYWELTRPQRALLLSLMDQQLWCWGQDIEHPSGNLLLEYGFARTRPPAGQKACSQYSLALNDDAELRLWGYGIALVTPAECCYFSRAAFSPALLKSKLGAAIFSSDDLPPLKYALSMAEKQRCQGYFTTVLREIADYESWVEDRLGVEYRETILCNRKHGIVRHREEVLEWAGLLSDQYQYAAHSA
jgi:hypothetical protein